MPHYVSESAEVVPHGYIMLGVQRTVARLS